MTERRKILFVDDETNVLEALQRMLRSRRNEWDMRFMNRPEDALTLMASESFHVVVSDMRMPGMDGSRFLGEVSARHPDVVRIILSGQSDRESLLHTTSLAHQFLSKPCDSETLKTAIDNVSNLHELLKNEALRRMISQLDALPSLPLPYLDLMRELRSAHASVDRVGRIIARDMGMTAKILHLANSAFFGVRLRVTDPAHAATLLGLETIKSLVLSVQVFRKFDLDAISFFSPEQLWEHSIVVGRLAQEMARETRRDDTFIHASLMAGLMHDIGKLVFAAKFASDWRIALSESASSGEPAIEAERRVLGATHAEMGAYLLGLWGLTHPSVEAAAFHHQPEFLATGEWTLPAVIYLANIIDHRVRAEREARPLPEINARFTARLDIEHRIPAWEERCHALNQEAPPWR